MPPEHDARRAIRDLVEAWALWRDAGEWERLRTVWHDDGRMMATWFQGSADDFVRVSREGFERGVRILHFLGGTAVDLAGDRAIAQTKMTISQRAEVEGVVCDVVCTGRFYDFLERRVRALGHRSSDPHRNPSCRRRPSAGLSVENRRGPRTSRRAAG